jgi:uncharacterized UBP type Zn finger protein
MCKSSRAELGFAGTFLSAERKEGPSAEDTYRNSEAFKYIFDMGFPEENVRRALEISHGNQDGALQYLLNQSTDDLS